MRAPRGTAAGGLGIVVCLLVATTGVAAIEPPRFVRASSPPGRTEANKSSFTPAISAGGRWVAFASEASNLVPGDTNSFREVVLHENLTGATTRVCAGLGGVQCDQSSTTPAIDHVGSRIVFASEAGDVVADDRNHATGIFVRFTDPAGN